MKSFIRKTGFLFTLLALLALVAGAFVYFRDTDGPQLAFQPQGDLVSGRPLTLEVRDSSGLKNLSITVTQGETSKILLSKSFDPGIMTNSEVFSLQESGLKDGPVQIRVTAADQAIYHFGAGNTTDQVFTFTYDGTPPRINVLSTAHNINQGGSGLIVYTISEEVEKNGVQVNDLFFPGYRLPSGDHACLFAFPHDLPLADFAPKLIAVDRAGNEGKGGFYYHANARKFRQDRINISDNFLTAKMPQFERLYPAASTPLDIFLAVNNDLRVKNRQELRRIGLDTAGEPLWQGDFQRMSGAANMAQFGDRRSYYYQGNKIDEQTHLGVDLASVKQAPVVASNDGRVVFADFFGIYGNCVILDHGLGLQTIYSHLSRIDVKTGEDVKKGVQIGRSGATGMAGGDHLHFGVMVTGIPVSPLEWWDGSWIRNNIANKLQTIK